MNYDILTEDDLYAIDKKAAADLAKMPKFTDEEREAMHASLYAEYRAKYQKECAEYREDFGAEPSLGTLMGAEMRAECNHHTEEERAANIAYGMAFIRAANAKRHAEYTTRS